MKKVKLREIAHSRAGDKGDISNISIIPYDEKYFDTIKNQITASAVKKHFSDIVKGDVVRYELQKIKSFNFVMHGALGGGVTRSLALDKHGKSYSSAILEMEIEID